MTKTDVNAPVLPVPCHPDASPYTSEAFLPRSPPRSHELDSQFSSSPQAALQRVTLEVTDPKIDQRGR